MVTGPFWWALDSKCCPPTSEWQVSPRCMEPTPSRNPVWCGWDTSIAQGLVIEKGGHALLKKGAPLQFWRAQHRGGRGGRDVGATAGKVHSSLCPSQELGRDWPTCPPAGMIPFCTPQNSIDASLAGGGVNFTWLTQVKGLNLGREEEASLLCNTSPPCLLGKGNLICLLSHPL